MKKIYYGLLGALLLVGSVRTDNGGKSYQGTVESDGGRSYEGLMSDGGNSYTGFVGQNAEKLKYLQSIKKEVKETINYLRIQQDWFQKNLEEALQALNAVKVKFATDSIIDEQDKELVEDWLKRNLEEALVGLEIVKEKFAKQDAALGNVDAQLVELAEADIK